MRIERKSKFYIFLIETLWVLLFFALTSIVCTYFFVKSAVYSNESVMKNEAMLIGQRVAEEMRIFEGSMEGYTKVSENLYEKKVDEYQVSVQTLALDCDYYQHKVMVEFDEVTLIQLEVMSGGAR